jgi:glycosyltransferase involved in cell wall biosynthesis
MTKPARFLETSQVWSYKKTLNLPKMTIALVVPNYPPTICGVGDHTFHLVQSMLKVGIDVHVICSANQKPVPVSKPTIYPIIEKWNKQGFNTVIEQLQAINPDWVVVQYVPHGFDPRGLPFPILGFYRALSQQKYAVLTVFHEVRVRPGNKLSSRFISAVETYIARKITQQSKKIVTSIDFYADLLRGGKEDRVIDIVPIGSGIQPIDTPPAVKTALKQRFNIPQNVPVIVTFGNRNMESYLVAFDRLAQDVPNFIWLLCGKISTPISVIESRPYLRHTGQMSASEIYQALSLGDVAFLPEPVTAKMEGGSSNKSTALACALSLGIPVIGIKGDMNNALLKPDENILLVDINQPNTLYEALKYCFHTEGVRQKLGQGARHLYDTALAWDVVGKQYLALMNVSISQQIQNTH